MSTAASIAPFTIQFTLNETYNVSRQAIDYNGRIGSLYDAQMDRFVKHQKIKADVKHSLIQNYSRSCYLTTGYKKYAGFLDFLGIPDDQKLSLLVGMVKEPSLFIDFFNDQATPIDDHTRFLYYKYTGQHQYLAQLSSFYRSSIDASFILRNANVTHIVTGVTWGIELLFIIHLPTDNEENCRSVNELLDKIRRIFNRYMNPYTLTQDEIQLWSKLKVTRYLRGAIILPPIGMIQDTLTLLTSDKTCIDGHVPISYELRSINFFPCNGLELRPVYQPTSDICKDVVRQLCLIMDAYRLLSSAINKISLVSLNERLSERTIKARTDINQIGRTIDSLFSSINQLLFRVRLGKGKSEILSTELQNPTYHCLLKRHFTGVLKECDYLQRKTLMITELTKAKIDYIDFTTLLAQHDNEKPNDVHDLLSKAVNKDEDNYVHFFCSSEEFRTMRTDTDVRLLPTIVLKSLSKRVYTGAMRIVYVDFSFCEQYLKKEHCFSYKRPEIQALNILILGESGVGKSTFINALVNYLAFDTLYQARDARLPLVLIPAAFVITDDITLEDVLIQFGESDFNENHEHPGQSVTQRCKTYIINISNRLELRLIDTPGIGDTRGPDQDELNMEHIFTYINNVQHLNAICILLKPNTTRLNVLFRSCMSKLFSYLSASARNNMLFCFTNSRTTFFKPGNTGPLLKKMLESLPVSNIPFGPKNTFFFDSESFRYLAAVQRDIPFNEYEHEQFEKSWKMSVKEAARLLEFVRTVQAYHIDDWRSNKHAEFEIKLLIRPLMEAIRNAIYNRVMQSDRFSPKSVKMVPKPISTPSTMCNNCSVSTFSIRGGTLWITSNPLHHPQTNTDIYCQSCSCPSNAHLEVYYALTYEATNYSKNTQRPSTDSSQLEECCVELAFLNNTIEDEMLKWLDRYIEEEESICQNQSMTSRNEQVKGGLTRVRTRLTTNLKEIYSKRRGMDAEQRLNKVYHNIKLVKVDPDVSAQMEAIKECQMTIRSKQECLVPQFPIENCIFKRLMATL